MTGAMPGLGYDTRPVANLSTRTERALRHFGPGENIVQSKRLLDLLSQDISS